MSKTTGACMFIKMQDLIASKMILEEKKRVSTRELYSYAQEISEKLGKKGINGVVMFGDVYLREFAMDYGKQFYVDSEVVVLREGYDIDWLVDNFSSYMSHDMLQLFGFLEEEKETGL